MLRGRGTSCVVEQRRVDRVRQGAGAAAQRGREIRRAARLDMPWARAGVARMLREAFLQGVLGPLMDFYVRRRTEGAERFRDIEPPVVLVANHSSHLDTPAILRSLPRRWRQRTAVAAAADYFYRNRLVAALVSLVFNTVPIQRRGGGLDEGAMEHLDELLEQRWNLLVYPEGTRSRDGAVGRMRSGAAVLASEHGISIVPIYVEGTHEAMPPGRSWPRRRRSGLRSRRHPVKVRFGEPIRPVPGEHRVEFTRRVRSFFDRQPRVASEAAAPPQSGGEPVIETLAGAR